MTAEGDPLQSSAPTKSGPAGPPFDLMYVRLDGGSLCNPPPSPPTEQTHQAEAGAKERKGGWQWHGIYDPYTRNIGVLLTGI